MTVERGATAAEAATARRLAAKLIQTYGLAASSPLGWRPPPTAPTPTAAETDRIRDAFRRMYTTPEEAVRAFQDLSAGWWFNIATGESSPNVTVHEYRDQGNWRIEIFPQ